MALNSQGKRKAKAEYKENLKTNFIYSHPPLWVGSAYLAFGTAGACRSLRSACFDHLDEIVELISLVHPACWLAGRRVLPKWFWLAF